MEEKVRLIIDGREIEALPGQSVLEAALAADIYIPHICTHPDLPVQANCKLCVVEIEGLDAPVCSCETEVKEGMVVTTKSDDLAHRRGVAMELTVTIAARILEALLAINTTDLAALAAKKTELLALAEKSEELLALLEDDASADPPSET